MKLILLGEPKSTNHIYKYHCKFGFPSGYLSPEGKKIKEGYAWEAKSQWKKKPSKDEFNISINLFFKSKAKHDIDNYGKLLLDSLTGIVWEDDSQISSMSVSKGIDKVNPRIELITNPISHPVVNEGHI